MKIEEKISKLPEGDISCSYFIFDENDKKKLQKFIQIGVK